MACVLEGAHSFYTFILLTWWVCCVVFRCRWHHCCSWVEQQPKLATCSQLLSSCHRLPARYSRWPISFGHHSQKL